MKSKKRCLSELSSLETIYGIKMPDYKQFSTMPDSYHVTFSYAYKGEECIKSYTIDLIEIWQLLLFKLGNSLKWI